MKDIITVIKFTMKDMVKRKSFIISRLSVALKVKEYLEESGVNVVMTRTSDRDVTNEQRVKTCNDSKASAMVSIHMN